MLDVRKTTDGLTIPCPGSSRKAPIYRRIARVFKGPYGPRITQNIRSCRCLSCYRDRLIAHVHSVNAYPQGYGKLAAIEACDPTFSIYRKFAWLRNRLLLHYQDELVQLEKQLEQLDQFHFREAPERLISRRRDDVFPEARRKDILKAIDAKLAEYGRQIYRSFGGYLTNAVGFRLLASTYAKNPSHQKAHKAKPEQLASSHQYHWKPSFSRGRVDSFGTRSSSPVSSPSVRSIRCSPYHRSDTWLNRTVVRAHGQDHGKDNTFCKYYHG